VYSFKPLSKEEVTEKLLQENRELRHRLEQADLKIESYEIMGDILQESYGVDSTIKCINVLFEQGFPLSGELKMES
jgi:hypothetical protein